MSARGGRLAHDVGKYAARIARNVAADGPFPEALRPLLLKDLFDLPAGGRASAVFEALAADCVETPALAAARAELAAIDALEGRLRGDDPDGAAALEACRRALRVEALLVAHAETEGR